MNSKFLQDHNHNNSSTRLLGTFVWLCVMVMWALLSAKAGVMQELPQTVLGVLGIATTWLAYNKYAELNVPPKAEAAKE